MYSNLYYSNQLNIDKIDNQIRDLENMRTQLQRNIPQQPAIGVIENLQKQINELKGRLDYYEQYVNTNTIGEIKNDEPPRVPDNSTSNAK